MNYTKQTQILADYLINNGHMLDMKTKSKLESIYFNLRGLDERAILSEASKDYLNLIDGVYYDPIENCETFGELIEIHYGIRLIGVE